MSTKRLQSHLICYWRHFHQIFRVHNRSTSRLSKHFMFAESSFSVGKNNIANWFKMLIFQIKGGPTNLLCLTKTQKIAFLTKGQRKAEKRSRFCIFVPSLTPQWKWPNIMNWRFDLIHDPLMCHHLSLLQRPSFLSLCQYLLLPELLTNKVHLLYIASPFSKHMYFSYTVVTW